MNRELAPARWKPPSNPSSRQQRYQRGLVETGEHLGRPVRDEQGVDEILPAVEGFFRQREFETDLVGAAFAFKMDMAVFHPVGNADAAQMGRRCAKVEGQG